MTTHQLIPVILSGGAGTRLWPVSRESHPKPFMLLPDGLSLLQKTFTRASQLPYVAEIMTITNKEYYLKSKAEYNTIASTSDAITHSYLLEPSSRNTAPAIALAALQAADRFGPETLLLILPADHLITDQVAFDKAIATATALAEQNKLVTFGIPPTQPETGYGYIEIGESIAHHSDGFEVARFVEKPSRDVAETYVASKKYLWNSGMFCFKASTLLSQLEKHAADLYQAALRCFQQTKATNDDALVQYIDATSFNQLENISIDYALMEKADAIALVRSHFDWQDIGSWDAYKQLFSTDKQGNTIVGNAILIDSENNFIQSETRMIASIGINNLAIIDTPDALLITRRDRTQDVKQVVQTLKNSAHESCLTHRTVIRPWGSYTVLEEGPTFKIKRISVNPHASLSLQTHSKRSEHWVVVSGTATVVNGENTYTLHTNESTFVPMGTVHRLANPIDEPLIIIEVQTGSYLGEDDIVRLEDTYGRLK